MTEKAKTSAEEFQKNTSVTDIECIFWGLARACPVPVVGNVGVLGAVVALQTGVGFCENYLLCAKIEGDRWFVHKGSRIDGEIDDEKPFDPKDLVVKDIRRDAFESEVRGRRTASRGDQLLRMAQFRRLSWNSAVAHAAWRAEYLQWFSTL